MKRHTKKTNIFKEKAKPYAGITKLDRLLPLLKGSINMLLFLLCGIYSLTDMGSIDDIWFVLFMVTMLRLVEGVDK